MFLGPGRNGKIDHGTPTHYGSNEIRSVRPFELQYCASLATVHCKMEMVYLRASQTGPEGMNKTLSRWFRPSCLSQLLHQSPSPLASISVRGFVGPLERGGKSLNLVYR